ncbi:unnamed protein product, partial [marine sediment metagenome]
YIKRFLRKRYALVTDDGQVIEAFRNFNTCNEWKGKLESIHLRKLNLVNLNDDVKLDAEINKNL